MEYIPPRHGMLPRFGIGGAPYDLVLKAACWAFLKQRSRELETKEERAAWAIEHRWPSPEWIAPGAVEQHAAATLAAPEVILDEAIVQAISEGGKYDPRWAFLFNQLIVVWHPGQREYRFPDIPDHPTANACRDYLRRCALALVDLPGQQPADHPDPFPILIEYATRHGWPELDALSARTTLWRPSRPK
jgi:hypothetical protein